MNPLNFGQSQAQCLRGATDLGRVQTDPLCSRNPVLLCGGTYVSAHMDDVIRKLTAEQALKMSSG